MAWDFRPGMRVVCVNADDQIISFPAHFGRICGLDGLERGRVYTIRSIGIHHRLPDVPVVWLEEIVRPIRRGNFVESGEPGFAAVRFRPLDERRIDCFRAHLAPRNVEIAA